jgi:hypothetical protein
MLTMYVRDAKLVLSMDVDMQTANGMQRDVSGVTRCFKAYEYLEFLYLHVRYSESLHRTL